MKLLKKGIRDDQGQYFPVFYCNGQIYVEGALKDCITIYSRTYKRFSDDIRQHFIVENDSDSMTDYFEKDRIRIFPDSPHFATLQNLIKK